MALATPILIAAGLLAACSPQPISLAPPVAPGVQPVAGAAAVRLDVVGQDKRTQFADRVGTFRGTTTRRVKADNDVADYVRSAVEQVLKAEGFVTAAGGLVVTVELQNFYCDVAIPTTAAVALTLRARTLGGRTLYTHNYDGTGTAGTFQTADNCKAALEQATAVAIGKVALDRDLQAALLAAGRQST